MYIHNKVEDDADSCLKTKWRNFKDSFTHVYTIKLESKTAKAQVLEHAVKSI